jgi:hypothetical protein
MLRRRSFTGICCRTRNAGVYNERKRVITAAATAIATIPRTHRIMKSIIRVAEVDPELSVHTSIMMGIIAEVDPLVHTSLRVSLSMGIMVIGALARAVATPGTDGRRAAARALERPSRLGGEQCETPGPVIMIAHLENLNEAPAGVTVPRRVSALPLAVKVR